nr:hypothetical protein [Pedobacter panaciterrae]
MLRLLFLIILFISPLLSSAQKIDWDHPSIIKLQNVFNSAVKVATIDNKLPWSSAIIVSDASVNHTLMTEFRNAEAYLRSIDQKTMMQDLDSCLQFHILFKSFQTSPELSAVKITDEQVVIKGIQQVRRTQKFPKISLESINFTTSLNFCSFVEQSKFERLQTDFNDVTYFNSVLPALKKIANELKDKQAAYRPEKIGDDGRAVRCTFFKGKEVYAQVVLSFAKQDYFGKIQNLEFVQKDKFIFDPYAPIEIDKLN